MAIRVLILFLLFSNLVNAQLAFDDVAAQIGVNYSYGDSEYGGGVSFADFDNDGWDDITYTSDNGDNIKMIICGNTVYNNWNRIPFYMTQGVVPPNGNPPSGNYGNANYSTILDISKGVENAEWLKNGRLNIVDSCFQNEDEAVALIYQNEDNSIQNITQKELVRLVNKIANSLVELGLKSGDKIAIDMPMTLEAVAIYLAGIKAGLPIVTIADSFTPNEIEVRLKITKPALIFTQDVIKKGVKKLPLFQKITLSVN